MAIANAKMAMAARKIAARGKGGFRALIRNSHETSFMRRAYPKRAFATAKTMRSKGGVNPAFSMGR